MLPPRTRPNGDERCRRRRLRPLALVLAALGALHAPAAGQQADTLPDPFAGIVHERLANGLTVWVKPLPGAAGISLSLAVAHGSDRDPPGREELAHLVEHALFSARDGFTEEQITRAIGDRGGSFNASTSPDRTVLWVSVGREHGGFALDWLYQRLRPRLWEEDMMPAVRDAVLLELGLGPRSLPARLRDRWLLHPALLPPGLWTREFGLHPPEYRRADLYSSIQRTTAADLESFYRIHYQPPQMTLLVAGDVDPARVLAAARATFGQLPVWPGESRRERATLRQGATRRFYWNLRKDVALTLSFRIDSLSADDHVRLLFTQQLLERRLLRRLRWGEQPAVYGVRTALVPRGEVALLRFEARIQPAAFAEARAIIEDELQRLRHGRWPPGEFEQDRAALDLRLRLNNGTPAALRAWHAGTFYRADRFPVPPALGQRFAAMTPEEVASFARRELSPEREIVSLEQPLPLGYVTLVALPLAALLLALRAARRTLLTPIELHRVHYVARLRVPLALALPAGLLLTVALLAGLRLLGAGAHFAAAALFWPRESLLLQATFLLLLLALATFLIISALALVPRKLLVLEHELRIKYLAYRSHVIPASEIEEVRLARFGDVFRTRRLLRTIPLTFGWHRPALLIRTRNGPDWFIASRNTAELAAAAARTVRRPTAHRDVWLAPAGRP